ncbi:50S ribosomal protein L10 [Candidatus Hepatincolaceae symbiont of Richtersius coronifer]
MKRLDKQELISSLNAVFKEATSVMVVHYKGLSVADLEALRKETAKVEIGFKIIKNSLASIALKDTKSKDLDEFLVGPTAIAWGNDPVSCAKTLSEFSKKKSNLLLVGGVHDGLKLSLIDIKTLSTLPSFDELRGKIAGLLSAVATKIAIVSRTPATMTIGVLEAYSKK